MVTTTLQSWPLARRVGDGDRALAACDRIPAETLLLYPHGMSWQDGLLRQGGLELTQDSMGPPPEDDV